jgi:outer membrane protein OmpA-like peptidoglycan-associated protein
VRKSYLFVLAALAWPGVASADDPRVHVTAGAAHAVGGTQEHEFGSGGGGSASVEIPVGNVVGLQASGGAVVLSAGGSPTDPTVAKQSTGAAFLGTVGVRFRPLGAQRVAGPWIDANGGFAQTGPDPHIAVDAHLGWDFRVSRSGRWDVGPFVGFTQIMQPDATLRPDDAHILWAGIQVSLGANEKPRIAPPPKLEEPEPVVRDRDGLAEVEDLCPVVEDGGVVPEGCPGPEVQLVGDRIVFDDVIHFEFNSPIIRPRSYGLVRKVAALIVEHPSILEVSIEGHADARGSEAYNLRLSEARAASTRELLVRFGVEEPRLRVVGYGKSRLKVATPLADLRNRRVEFTVTRSADDTAKAGPPSPTPKIASGKRSTP